MRRKITAILVSMTLGVLPAPAQQLPEQGNDSAKPSAVQPAARAFKVKYVAQDTVYLASGRAAGLANGMKLVIRRVNNVSTAGSTGEGTDAQVVAELEVIAVAETSAVCSVEKSQAEIQAGDFAYFTQEQAEINNQQQSLSGSRKYPQVIAFSEGDPLEEEIRDEVPRLPLPEVNRLRGRIGFDYSMISSGGTTPMRSSQTGVVFRADMTRIGGTYWNLSGYWRGRLTSTTSDQQQSLQDLINRTYHLGMTYENPKSRWVAGFGRLYVPWASSLETIDGGYGGRKIGRRVTVGLFAGTTPDPTSWSYAPDRRLAGNFINVEGGSFDDLHYTSTSGVGVSMLNWVIDRPFVFFENSVAYKRYFSVYQSLQADNPKDSTGLARVGAGVGRSFVTVHIQPTQRLSFDVNHNYMRDVPTFDPRLIGTGLLDKYLFQGLSVGGRAEIWRHVSFYTTIGRSNRSGDAQTSWNKMYGVTAARIWRTGLRADIRYSEFNSSFGSGRYEAVSLSRAIREGIRFEAQFGKQSLASKFSSQTDSRFVSCSTDINIGPRYFLQANFNADRGGTLPYNQWSTTFGYRFDNRTAGKRQ